MAFILVVAILHIVNNLALPVSWGHAKSYTIWPGVQDAMVQWWYGHNAVAFFLTAGFLGMLYYYLPVRAQRPIFSYRLSILSFWGITFFYMWAGSHHLHYTALPHWVQTLRHDLLGDAAGAFLGFGRQRAAYAQRCLAPRARRCDAALHDGRGGLLRPLHLRRLVHGDPARQLALATTPTGRSAMSMPGRWDGSRSSPSAPIYTLVPTLWKRERMYSAALVEVHFWLAIAGTLIYVFAMWNSGIIQGLMWRTYTEEGALAYSFVNSLVAMYPYYIARAFGGLLFLLGAVVGCYNIWMTVRSVPLAVERETRRTGRPRRSAGRMTDA